MQDATARSELHSLHSSRDLPLINNEPTGLRSLELAGPEQPTGTLKAEPPVGGTQSPLVLCGPISKEYDFLPQRGLYYAVITGVIAGVFTALLTIVVTLVFAGTFHAASQQIAVDRLTVKTALALAGLVLLNFTLCLLLCLWSIGGGLVSLFGTWVATVRHPHYLRFGEE